ncbi:MAG: DUF4357 domain-containing protein [Patescibacteria group bacterium]|nr:DUF4357 domain-containing protein [Patescibacteria group bacterium]
MAISVYESVEPIPSSPEPIIYPLPTGEPLKKPPEEEAVMVLVSDNSIGEASSLGDLEDSSMSTKTKGKNLRPGNTNVGTAPVPVRPDVRDIQIVVNNLVVRHGTHFNQWPNYHDLLRAEGLVPEDVKDLHLERARSNYEKHLRDGTKPLTWLEPVDTMVNDTPAKLWRTYCNRYRIYRMGGAYPRYVAAAKIVAEATEEKLLGEDISSLDRAMNVVREYHEEITKAKFLRGNAKETLEKARANGLHKRPKLENVQETVSLPKQESEPEAVPLPVLEAEPIKENKKERKTRQTKRKTVQVEDRSDNKEGQNETLSIEAKGIKANGHVDDNGFMVLKGSQVVEEEQPTIAPSTQALRSQLIADGIVVKRGSLLAFAKDHVFGSPSTAAAVILGRTANGRIEWKGHSGRTLKQIQNG